MEFDILLRDAIAKVWNVDAARVRPDAKLADLGLDSLRAAEILVQDEIRLGRDLPVDVLRRLDKADTVGDITAQLRAVVSSMSKKIPRRAFAV